MEFDPSKIEINYEENMHKKVNNLILTDKQMQVLDRYEINYLNCSSMNELLFYISECLEEVDDEQLEQVEMEIAEINYYANTNK